MKLEEALSKAESVAKEFAKYGYGYSASVLGIDKEHFTISWGHYDGFRSITRINNSFLDKPSEEAFLKYKEKENEKATSEKVKRSRLNELEKIPEIIEYKKIKNIDQVYFDNAYFGINTWEPTIVTVD